MLSVGVVSISIAQSPWDVRRVLGKTARDGHCFEAPTSHLYVYVYVYTMGTKTITVTEEAYDRLRAMKRSDESFTDVLLRVTGGETDVMKGFGAWKDSGLREAVDDAHEEFDDSFDARQDSL